jgi:hypothetical protein
MVEMNRNFLRKFCFVLGFCGFILGAVEFSQVPNTARAIQYRDGTTAFSYPPRLTHARTTRNLVGENNPTYYISFTFPAAAEEPLDKVVISLDEGRRDPVFGYQLDATRAFASSPQGDEELSLGNVTQDNDTKTLTIQFDPPVLPGNPITLALKPNRNPRFEGVYLFGINAFPVGAEPEPTFVGYARLSFYRPSRGIWR